MTTLTHITSGLVIAKFASTNYPNSFSPELIYGLSVTFSLLPDVNMLWHKEIKTHHNDFTHYPIFWLAVSLIVFVINRFMGILLLANTMLHLFLDTFGWTIGVKWLIPFKSKEYSFTKLEKDKANYSLKERFQYLVKNPNKLTMEILINVLFIVLLVV